MKRTLLVVLFFLSFTALWAQAAVEMESALKAPAVSWRSATYFVLLDQGKTTQEAANETSWQEFLDAGWVAAPSDPSQTPSAQDLALLVARAYALEGGVLYRWFPSGRYALRQLVFTGVFSAALDPTAPVTGADFFKILGKARDRQTAAEGNS